MRTDETGWPNDKASLSGALAQTRLPKGKVELVLASARRATMLAATPVADEGALPVGTTRIGGLPDLPPGMAWPVRHAYADGETLARNALANAEYLYATAGIAPPWMDPSEGEALLARHRAQQADTLAFLKTLPGDGLDFESVLSSGLSTEACAAAGRAAQAQADAARGPFPLAFLAQIDLAALPDDGDPGLPRAGRLYFFYDLFVLPPSSRPSSGIGLHVFHDETPAANLSRAAPPPPLAAIADLQGASLRPCRVDARTVETVVPAHSHTADALGLSDEEWAAYDQWLLNGPGWPGDGVAGAHQLGGWPRAIQTGMEGQAQLASHGIDTDAPGAFETPEARRLLADAARWRLLFQLGPDEAIGNMLPGALDILLREDDLAARRFDRAWAVYEQS